MFTEIDETSGKIAGEHVRVPCIRIPRDTRGLASEGESKHALPAGDYQWICSPNVTWISEVRLAIFALNARYSSVCVSLLLKSSRLLR